MRLRGRFVADIARQFISIREKGSRALGEVESFGCDRRYLRVQFSHSGEYNFQRILRSFRLQFIDSLCFKVYGWNSAIAMICGNTIVWKEASSTPLVAIATTKIIASVLERNGIPGSVASLITGGPDIGETLVNDKRLVLI